MRVRRAAIVCLLALVLRASLDAAHADPGAATAKPVLFEVKGLGWMVLMGKDQRTAAKQYADSLVRRNVFPGFEKKLGRWEASAARPPTSLAALKKGDRPIVGIQLNSPRDLVHGDASGHKAAKVVEAVKKAGGVPLLLPPAYDARHISTLLGQVDHVVLLGGADLHPSLYGKIKTYSQRTNLVRDRYEMKVIREAMRQGKGLTGICRGCQALNVATGGTLSQDIRKTGKTPLPHRIEGGGTIYHPVQLEAGSGSACTFGTTRIPRVPSLHHQAVEKLGRGVRVTGRSPEGIAEVIEGLRGRIRGYQFHPELDPKLRDAVFRDVTARARRTHAQRFGTRGRLKHSHRARWATPKTRTPARLRLPARTRAR